MKTIVEILNSKKTNAWFSKSFTILKPYQLQFVEDYLVEYQNKEFNEFHKDLNRLFIINKVENIQGKVYSYNEVFPVNSKGNHPRVSTAQELISAVFNDFKGQGK